MKRYKNKPHVLILHGVLMNAVEMFYLAHRLKNTGFIVHRFSYQSVLKTPLENASILHKKILALNLQNLHIVAHSLGGIVATHLLAKYNDIPNGNIVMLGTPIKGSWFANRLRHYPLISILLRKSMKQGLSGLDVPNWSVTTRRWGMIAGDAKFGLAMIVGGLPEAGDGVVMLKETQHPQIDEHIILPVSHTGMLFSKDTAKITAYFLKKGVFPFRE
jgi:pimeloyl-ACP methyl ester carboxylesterase